MRATRLLGGGLYEFNFIGSGYMTIKDLSVVEDGLHVDPFDKTVTLTTTVGSDTLVNLDGVLVAILTGVTFGSATYTDLLWPVTVHRFGRKYGAVFAMLNSAGGQSRARHRHCFPTLWQS